jgi:hypothetical protein
MLTCIIIILVIIIIIIIAGACYYGYNGQQNYVYYDGVKYYRGKNGFFNKNKRGKNNRFDNMNGVISNVQHVPPPLQPQNVWKKSVMDNNIDSLRGSDPKLFNYIYPKNGGNNLTIPDKNCVGFGENTSCEDFYDYIENSERDNYVPNNYVDLYKNNKKINHLINEDFRDIGRDMGRDRRDMDRDRMQLLKNNQHDSTISAKISSAEQELYMANRNNSTDYRDRDFGSSLLVNNTQESNYAKYLDSLVIDERTMENHLKWANEMTPWSGTARGIDDLDEAMGQVNFVGLRRPQPISQSSDALFITEIGAKDFINNPKFNFKG